MTTWVSNDMLKHNSHKHEEIMRHLIKFPEMPLYQVAKIFQVTQPWLSTLVHSDIFQAQFAEMREEHHLVSCVGVSDKLNAIAHTALDKLAEELAESENPDFIKNVADSALDRLGFGTKGAGISVSVSGGGNATVSVGAATLEKANALREKVRDIKGEVVDAQTERVRSSDESHQGGEAEPALIHSPEEGEGGEASGDTVRASSSQPLCREA